MPDVCWLSNAQELGDRLMAQPFSQEWLHGALMAVPRHLFVDVYYDEMSGMPEVVDCDCLTESQLRTIYSNTTLLVGYPPAQCECCAPQLILSMLADLEVAPGHRVLIVGTGTGWSTALITHAVGDDSLVYSVEIDPDLLASAQSRLASLGLRNVNLSTHDGSYGWPEAAPFDRILVTTGMPDIPLPWVDQLSEDGVIVLPLEVPGCGNPILRIRKTHGTIVGEFTNWSRFRRCKGDFGIPPRKISFDHKHLAAQSASEMLKVSLYEKLSRDFLFYLHTTIPEVVCFDGCRLLESIGVPLMLGGLSTALADHQQPLLYVSGEYQCVECIIGCQEDWIALGRPDITQYKVEVVPSHLYSRSPGELADVRASSTLKLSLPNYTSASPYVWAEV